MGHGSFTGICVYYSTWVICRTYPNEQNTRRSTYGQIVEIISSSQASAEGAVAVLGVFRLRASCHPIFNVLVLSDGVYHLAVNLRVSGQHSGQSSGRHATGLPVLV